MTQFPSLPLFTDAFIADTGHLTAHQTGAYLLLLMAAWRMPDGRLPNDDAKLAGWARVSRNTWPQTKRIVMEFWTLSEDGFWSQKRLAKELLAVRQAAERSRDNGKFGGRPTLHRATSSMQNANAYVPVTDVKKDMRNCQSDIHADAAKSLKTNKQENPAGSSQGTQKKAPNPNPIKEREKRERNDRVWVARDTPEWTAWQRVKKRGSIFSNERQENGWWFESQWPPDHVPGPAPGEPSPNPEEA